MVQAAFRVRLSNRVLVALLAASGALAGCGDDRPFSRNNTASEAAKLAVPSTLTPPVRVGQIDGAPEDWQMAAKLAEALRQRDIPAGTEKHGQSAYTLRGTVRPGDKSATSDQVSLVWSLFDADGKKVGEVTQIAAVPKAAMRKANHDVVEAIADAAAESISPIVPSTQLDIADNRSTGEVADKDQRAVPAKKVTALGQQKKSNSGIAQNFDAHVKGKKLATDVAMDLPKPLARRGGDPKKDATTALGRMDDGISPLSRNLAKGLNPAAGDSKGPADRKSPPATDQVDARPPELTDPDRRAPQIAFRQRPASKAAPKAMPPRTQTAEMPPAKPAGPDPEAKKVARPAVMTEFYPMAPKASDAPKPGRRVEAAPRRAPPRKSVVAQADKPTHRPATLQRIARKPEPKPAAPDPVSLRQPAAAQQPERPDDTTATSGGLLFWVQVGSYRTAELSAAQWTRTRERAPSLLGDVTHRIARARVGDSGIWHRIQVGPYASRGAALEKCRRLKAARVDCFILPERGGSEVEPISRAPDSVPRRLTASTSRMTVVTNDVAPPTARPPRDARKTSARPGRPNRSSSERKRFPLTTSPGLPGLIP